LLHDRILQTQHRSNLNQKGAQITLLENYSDLLTVEELCEVLMVGRNSAYKTLDNGCLNAFRVGRRWKIPKAGVIDFLARHQSIL